MNKHQKDTWLSVHLFYNEPWEEFLQEAIEPYVNTAIQTGIAEKYFFIRYWEKGPHIRLRFKGDVDMINTILKPNLEEHFNNYFDSKPSRRIEPNYPPNFSEDLKWEPNNTIAYIKYEPEVERFGGDIGIRLSQKQFMLSSQTVLELIKHKGRTWSYDDAMGAAIKLHLSFIHAAGMSIDEAISFFDFFAKNWLSYTFKNIQEEIDEEDYEHQAQLSIQAFEKSFENQKKVLIPFHATLWNALENGDSFDENNLNIWIDRNNLILAELIAEIEAGNITPRTSKYQYQIKSEAYPQKELLWSILTDYIHLTNNRLGIFNRDESYLSFMMMKCLVAIKKNENKLSSVMQ